MTKVIYGLIQLNMSFMYKRKRRGPTTESCGTPNFSSSVKEDCIFLTISLPVHSALLLRLWKYVWKDK